VGVYFYANKIGDAVSINASQEFPAASCAKVPVLMAVFHLSDNGKLDLNQKVLFQESDKLGGAGVLQWLKGDREYTIWNLSRLMIVLSDNTATRLVVRTVGMPAINDYIASIGLTKTRVVDPTMLSEPPSLEVNMTTPAEMANAILRIGSGWGFSQASQQEMLKFLRNQKYRWGIIRGLPPGIQVANKTGQLDKILNDAGIVYTKKGNYVLSIFTRGFEKKREARELINEISKLCYEEFTGEKVIKPQLSRRPSPKLKPRKGRRVKVSYRKSRTYRRR